MMEREFDIDLTKDPGASELIGELPEDWEPISVQLSLGIQITEIPDRPPTTRSFRLKMQR